MLLVFRWFSFSPSNMCMVRHDMHAKDLKQEHVNLMCLI